MRIRALSLIEHKRLQVARIKELHLRTDRNLQLIIGSNGAGKSSVLSELFPTAPTISDFSKTGFKSIELSHHGSDYVLTYSPKEGHQFSKDGVPLNRGTTNEVQRELIEQHLGLNQLRHQILRCNLPICEMQPSQRKKALMELNPTDVSLFIDRHRKVRKDVTSYSNNLRLLYQRQKTLVEQKLPTEQFQKMQEQQRILMEQEQTLLVWLTQVKSELDSFQGATETVNFDELVMKVRYLFKELAQHSGIDRGTYKTRIIEAPAQIGLIQQEIADVEQRISEVVKVLDDYELKKRQLSTDGSNVADELAATKRQLDTIRLDPDYRPTPVEDLQRCYALVDRLQGILVEITYLNYPEIKTPAQLQELHRQLTDQRGQLAVWTNERTKLEQRIQDLNNAIRTYEITDRCPKEGCGLLSSYQKHLAQKTAEHQRLKDEVAKITTEHEQLSAQYQTLGESYQTQVQVWKHLQQVLDIVKREPELHRVLTEESLIDSVSQSPIELATRYRQHLELSEKYHIWETLKKQVVDLEQKQSQIAEQQQWSATLLDEEIKRHSRQLEQLRDHRECKVERVSSLQNEHRELAAFKETTDHIQRLDTDVSLHEQEAVRKASYQYLDRLREIIYRMLTRTRAELAELSRVIKDQELLLSRLDQEVDQIVAKLQPRYDQAQQLEHALSELPVIYTTKFVNGVLSTANYFIGKVMTYPMQLITYEAGRECDFTLPILIDNNVRAKDISTCSAGQQAVIQLCFCLALVVQLGLVDYPVYVDEVDRTLDSEHKRRLTELLLTLISEGVVGQLFVINHSPSMIEGLSGSGDVLVLHGDNIQLPGIYNQHADIVYY